MDLITSQRPLLLILTLFRGGWGKVMVSTKAFLGDTNVRPPVILLEKEEIINDPKLCTFHSQKKRKLFLRF